MKPIFALIAILTLSLQPAVSAVAVPTASPRADVKTFVLRQATTVLNLEHKEYGAGSGVGAGVCFRDVQHGTKQSCSMQNRHQCAPAAQNQCHGEAFPVCHNVQQNVCNPVSFPVCQSVPRNVCESVSAPVCSDVPQQVCDHNPVQECQATEVPVCESVPRSVCETTQSCEIVQDSVCHGDVCQMIPRSVCKPVESCHPVSDSVCHNETRNSCSMVEHQSCRTETRRECHTDSRQECHAVPDSVCHQESRQECHLENQNQCHDEYRQVCENNPSQQCTDTPHQVCLSVPNIVSEPYACNPSLGRADKVLKSHTTAEIKILVSNFSQASLRHDVFRLVLSQGDVKLVLLKASNKIVLHVLNRDLQVLNISNVEKHLSAIYTIEVLTPKQARQQAGLAREALLNPELLDRAHETSVLGSGAEFLIEE